jgi:cyclopropane fatty-acyl-phospholipid synthase-like methyltransferase
VVVQVVDRLLDAARVAAPDRVLDVATGSGNAAEAAARRGVFVIGLTSPPSSYGEPGLSTSRSASRVLMPMRCR